jgi:hypothetical protein
MNEQFFPPEPLLARRARRLSLALVSLLLLSLPASVVARSAVVNKWQVFETDFRSSRDYLHAIHDVRLEIEFTAPSGARHRTYGFWDGTSRWKVRFSPDEIGTWTFRTDCSVTRDSGLHDRTGEFVCTVPSQASALSRCGPIKAAAGASHFEHADGTPFFWLADAALPGALTASSKEWTEYVSTRAAQGFTVALWRADSIGDGAPPEAYQASSPIEPQVSRLRRLDDVVEQARDAGLVSAVVPFSEVGVPEDQLLPEAEVVALVRQIIARWDALPVTWVMCIDGKSNSRKLARGRRILRHVFERIDHAPVMVFCGEGYWALEDFREDAWANALAYQTGNHISPEATLWLTSGPISTIWQKEPWRPLLNVMPAAEASISADGALIGSEAALRVLCRSLFVAPPAGVCYRARGVEDWDTARDTNTQASVGVALQGWQKSLHLPAAKRLAAIRALFEQSAFPLLEPKPGLLASQPGVADPRNHVSVLGNVNSSTVLVHVPAGQVAQLQRGRLPAELELVRLDIRTGELQGVPVEEDNARLTLRAPAESDCLFKLSQR